MPAARPIAALLAIAVALAGALAAAPARAAGVVGDGTPGSCTGAALAQALQGGGTVSFSCGAAPLTIVLGATLEISAPSTTIDGGGLITLSGGGARRIIRHRSLSSASALTLRDLALIDGRAQGVGAAANGAAVLSIFQGASASFTPTLTLERVSIRGSRSVQTGSSGNAYDYGGGAIYSQGGAVVVSESSLSDNHADNGGGGAIHILQSRLTIRASSLTGNSAIGATPASSQGGAIYIDGLGGAGGALSISDSTLSDNRAYNSGGAIYVNMYENSSRALIERSSFIANAVVGGSGALGGAISGGGTSIGGATGNPQIEIRDSTFARNSARRSAPPYDGSGGALAFAQRAAITISNSTFSANRAEGSSWNANGGALYVVNQTTPFSISSSTFADNYAGWVGGAVSSAQIGGAPGGSARNTIFARNSAGNGGNSWQIQQHCSSELSDGGQNLQHPPRNTNPNTWNELTCLAGKSAIAQRSLPDFRDPQVGELGDTGGPTMTIPLAHTSPAIDAGASCPAADQRGVSRSGACDIGAHEFAAQPYVAALVPPFARAGGAGLTLIVDGADFDAGSVVLWGGQPRPTELISSARLVAQIGAGDLASAGVVLVGARNGDMASAATPRSLRVVASATSVLLPLVVR